MIDDDFPPMAGQAPQYSRAAALQQEPQQQQEAFPDLSSASAPANSIADGPRQSRPKR